MQSAKCKAQNLNSGQATTEMVFLIPLFVVLAAGCIFVAYIGWQGIKVQQAANMAARYAGQEIVAGGRDLNTIMRNNGLVTGLGAQAVGDPDPDTACNQSDEAAKQQCLQNFVASNGVGGNGSLGTKLPGNQSGGVYWDYRKLVYQQFNAGEQKQLYVLIPRTNLNTHEVIVKRVLRPPKIFDWQPPIITLTGKAYGGEDTYLFSLPRTGETDNSGQKFWEKALSDPKNKDTAPPD